MLCSIASDGLCRVLGMCWCFPSHSRPVSQELDIELNCTIAAESLANMPVSLMRLVLGHCSSVPASSLASIGRLSALSDWH